MRKKLFFEGFSLIELMIAVLIISILTSLAIPSYKHYIMQARFSEVIAATEPYKVAIALALQQGFSLKTLNNNKAGIPEEPLPTKNLAQLKVAQGIITATGTPLVKNTTYILIPNAEGSRWKIKGSCLHTGLCAV